MAWLRKFTRTHDEENAVRPEPQIIEVGDGEEGAELVFAETAPTTPPRKGVNLFAHNPQTLPVEEEEQQGQREEDSLETAGSISLTKDLVEHEMELRGKLMRRIIALLCLLLIVLAITLGIVFGTKRDKDVPTGTTNRGVDSEVPTNIISNDECFSSSQLLPDGSSDVGVISAAAESSFSNGGGKCGEATYGVGPGRWYYTQGIGGFLKLSACAADCTVPDNSLAIPEVSVFTGDCVGLYCVDGVSNLITNNPFQFQAIRGQDYFIYVQGGEESLGLFEITLTEA
jgi:hypothetical protein